MAKSRGKGGKFVKNTTLNIETEEQQVPEPQAEDGLVEVLIPFTEAGDTAPEVVTINNQTTVIARGEPTRVPANVAALLKDNGTIK